MGKRFQVTFQNFKFALTEVLWYDVNSNF